MYDNLAYFTIFFTEFPISFIYTGKKKLFLAYKIKSHIIVIQPKQDTGARIIIVIRVLSEESTVIVA
jgi:hypothetical protein